MRYTCHPLTLEKITKTMHVNIAIVCKKQKMKMFSYKPSKTYMQSTSNCWSDCSFLVLSLCGKNKQIMGVILSVRLEDLVQVWPPWKSLRSSCHFLSYMMGQAFLPTACKCTAEPCFSDSLLPRHAVTEAVYIQEDLHRSSNPDLPLLKPLSNLSF